METKRIAILRSIKTLMTRSERAVLAVYECRPPFGGQYDRVCVTTDGESGSDRAVISIYEDGDADRSDSEESPAGAILDEEVGDSDMIAVALERRGYEICLGREIVSDAEMLGLIADVMSNRTVSV
jgi:hypothetical protein